MDFYRYALVFGSVVFVLPGCGSDSMSSGSMTSDTTLGASNPAPLTSDDQTPPSTNGKDVEAWLATGKYMSWACEMDSHAAMKVSPHGQNKICSNNLVANFSGATGSERPVGSAAVKELYDDAAALVGYAVYVKVKPTTAGGANWYWYERVPLTSAAPHNSMGVVADGLGSAGTAQTICVGCHAAAASDDAHSVTKSGDYVYDQISG
jgi:hypothetical protein